MKTTLPPIALGAILLAEGWASLGTEILALRRMVPWAGSSVDVTSVLLAVYLAALAGGYRRGGRLAASGDPRPRLALRLAAAAAWAAFWLADPGIGLVFSLPLPPLLQAAVYSTVGIAPVGWLLAESVLLAHACAPRRNPSETAGGVFALSTIGNVAGALGATFLLLPTLGLAAATLAVVAAPAAAALLASRRNVPVVALLIACCWPVTDLWVEATEYVARNAYADYRFVEVDDSRVLIVNNQMASRHDPQGRGWDYAELFERTLCEAGETRTLVLGAAGMTIGRGAPCELDLTFVDVDPAQQSISAEFLGLPQGTAGKFAGRDARAFLREDPGGWQAIVVDVFSNPLSTPQHLLTAEFYRLVRSKLDDGGSLYVNHTAYPGEELFLTRVERTLRSVFANCSSRTTMDFATETGWHAEASMPRNLLFRCRKSELDADRAVYSDAVPRAELDRSLRLQGRP